LLTLTCLPKCLFMLHGIPKGDKRITQSMSKGLARDFLN